MAHSLPVPVFQFVLPHPHYTCGLLVRCLVMEASEGEGEEDSSLDLSLSLCTALYGLQLT